MTTNPTPGHDSGQVQPPPRGRLVVISGPSGAGKSSLTRAALNHPALRERAELSISATTRPPRPGELNGRDYWFLDPEEFQKRRDQGRFLETAEVFGNWYGTPVDWVDQRLAQGRIVLLEIDVAGARQIRKARPDAILIFVHPPNLAILEQRLRGRGSESEEAIARRLAHAQKEIDQAHVYDFEILNDLFEPTVERLVQIILNPVPDDNPTVF
ncbi:guanylate kinase [Isosphaera pallida ATCC 43644]|uniref:Guanylate kinase n=1 Tax=Isosphaera pallida (strain ATCC 43644 / DSM 9630 / IS1B) TaxID=575540 RepID=E8R226_ISOPI|nr:guanylate kinase [Isosphaera pallida]ADV62458.1 guanylate kinase [Isosphaera pallida ATCC 43644]